MAESSIILGKYELLEVIGDGAEGRVYKASCISDGVPGVAKGELVALKRLKSTGHEKESLQFRRQTEILRKLNHPNIVSYRDSFVWREKELEEDIQCLVMELLDGEPLKALMEKHRNGIPWEQSGDILSQVLQALQHASKVGVVHRDLKPSNIFITEKGVPKLVDFGIARQDDGEATATSSAAGAKGTFDYMAPDFALQPGGFRGDQQSDIFSFGVLVFHALTGRLPFPALGENADRAYYIRWLGKSPPSAEFRHPIFRVLSHARTCIAKCIDLDRQVRFKTFDEVMDYFATVGHRKLKHGSETYEFIDWLGKGGFGEVFHARRISDKRHVAVKRLFSASQSSRFVREAKILREAAHPNLTEYVDFVEVKLREEEREYYLILEYLTGMPDAGLRDRIKNSESGLEPAEALKIFIGYLDCLEHLHRNGIIHRDIKPGNLYAPAGHPEKAKIFDLGIAHDEEGTRTHGQVPGTLDFMPPEFATQSSGRGSAQSDIYSIAVTLYISLTKKLPFPRLPEKEADAYVAFIRRSQNPLECTFEHPIFTRHPEMVPLLRRALANDPKQRHESAKAMQYEIRGILEGWEKKKAYDAAMAAGQTALEQQDYNEAKRQAVRATELMPQDEAAKQSLSQAQDGIKRTLYNAAVASARAALGGENFEEAEQQAARALELMPSDKAAQQLLTQAQKGRLHKQSVSDIEDRPTTIVVDQPTAATNVSAGGEPDEDATAETRPGDLEKILEFEKAAQEERKKKEQVEREQSGVPAGGEPAERATAQTRPGDLEKILEFEKAAQEERRRQKNEKKPQAMEVRKRRNKAPVLWMVTVAIMLVLAAGLWKVRESSRTNKRGEASVTKPTDAQAAQLAQEKKYKDAMDAGQSAYDQKAYDVAIEQAEPALAIKPEDAAATKLNNDSQARQKEIVAQAALEKKYKDAMDAGQKAYDQKAYDIAIEQVEAALAIKPGDAAATKLNNDSQAHQKEIAAQAALDKKYKDAVDAGQNAYGQKVYGTAVEWAEVALASRPGDPAAAKLKTDAQKKLDLLDSRVPLKNLFGVPNFDFIWVTSLRNGDGAYVEKTEMSQAQYNSVAGQYGLTPSKMQISGATPDDPINLTYQDAAGLRDDLNKAVRQTKLQGQFQLPGRQDFLTFSEIKDSIGSSNPSYNALAGLLSRFGANTSGTQPRHVEAGSTNKFGLFNVLGNAWEWCDDQSGAGFEYDSKFGSLFRDHKDVQGLYTGVRFVFVPDQ